MIVPIGQSRPLTLPLPTGIRRRIFSCHFSRSHHYAHNRQSEIIRQEDGNGTVHEYVRDRMGRLLHDCVTVVGDGVDDAVRRISTAYDAKRPTLVAATTSYDDATPGQGAVLNQVARQYDDFWQEIEDAQAHDGAVEASTPKVSYSHADGSSGNTARRETVTYPDGRQVGLGYGAADSIEDLFSLVKTVAIDGETGDKIAYTRVGLARFVEIAYPQPDVRMTMMTPGGGSEGDAGDPYDGFDRFGRTQAMRWEEITGGAVRDGWHWGFNEASNRTWKQNLVAEGRQDEAYGYDGLYQVTRDAVGALNINRTLIGGIPTEEERFAYDSTGNWLSYCKDEDGSPVLDQTRTSNQDNQLTQIDASSQGIKYDGAGNATLLRPGLGGDWAKHFELVWDAWNRLVNVKDESGASVQKNRYDGLTRRIVNTAGGVDTHYYYNDRWKCVEERLDSATTAARSYLWGERPGHRDELCFRDRDTNGDGTLDERLYATMDYFNGTAILDTAGAVMERYAYSAFGVRRVMAPDFSARTGSDFAWDFGFQGQFRDAETGWYDYGYRYYVPELGRWPSRDPIGEKGGLNEYSLALNNTINLFDKYGLYPSSRFPTPKMDPLFTPWFIQCWVTSPVRCKKNPSEECPGFGDTLTATATSSYIPEGAGEADVELLMQDTLRKAENNVIEKIPGECEAYGEAAWSCEATFDMHGQYWEPGDPISPNSTPLNAV